MLAPQNFEPGIGDIMSNTSIAKWYDDVESCFNDSEVIPGTYEYTTATAWGNVGAIAEGASTNFTIKANRYNIISLENSYITLEQRVPIRIPTQANSGFTKFYVGYLMSAACIGSYRLYSETTPIAQQNINHAHYEWFMLYNSMSDVAKENNPAFATINKIREMNPNVPGVYIDTTAINGDTDVMVTIPLKIPLSQFLMLTNLKWIPDWMGSLRIEAIPSYRNIVIAPVIPQGIFETYSIIQTQMDAHNIQAWQNNANADALVDFGFYQLNMNMKNRIQNNLDANTCNFMNIHRWTCNTQTTDRCQIRLAMYQLQAEMSMALANKYAEEPMLFPIQLIEAKDYTTPLGSGDPAVNNGNPSIDTAMTVWLKNCDSCYTIFKEDGIYSTQRFVNPMIRFSLNINGKIYPREEYETIDDLRTINMTLDAMNVNNSGITSISRDLRTSLQETTRVQVIAQNGAVTHTYQFTNGTRSNFMIGIPFSDSEIFQGGITTPATVQIQLKGSRVRSGATGGPLIPVPKILAYTFAQPVSIFMQDAILKIRSIPTIGRPQFDIVLNTYEQIRGAM